MNAPASSAHAAAKRAGGGWLRGTLAVALLLAIAAAWWLASRLGWTGDAALDRLRSAADALAALRDRAPLATMAGYAALYVLATALSLPGAVLLTLAGGALFGLGWGTAVVSLASTLGAVLAFWTSRYLLREGLRRRHGRWLAEIDRGFASDGAWYLLSLRLVPLVPFVVVNLALGLTSMRTAVYAATSWLGMLPATIVYVNAGTQLAQLRSLRDLASPTLWLAFAALAALPLAARWATGQWRVRRRLAPWAALRPRRYDRDLIVIGAGSAGLVASYVAAAVRARVTLVEAGPMGGDCLNTGCVPSKALIHAARLAAQARDAARWGIGDGTAPGIDFAVLKARLRTVIADIAPHDSVERYTSLGVEVLRGRARLLTPWQVEIAPPDGPPHTLTARRLVIATGARPRLLPVPGLAEGGVRTSETLWDLARLPTRLLVIGGGPIGCELAQAFARLGSRVVLIEQAPRLLAREDSAVSAAVAAALQRDGVELRCSTRLRRAERLKSADGALGDWRMTLSPVDGSASEIVTGDEALCAVGRVARLDGLGLEALGLVPDDDGRLPTDAWLRTALPHIHAAGDVTGPWQYTHAAGHQGATAALNALFGAWRRGRDTRTVMPAVTYVDPEVARVGLNEQEARAAGVPYELTRWPLHEGDRAIVEAGGVEAAAASGGCITLLTVPGRDRILGATIVGPEAGELIAEVALAMRHRIGLNGLLASIHAYPTRADGTRLAAGAWRRAHTPAAALRWLERWHRWRRG